MPLKHANFLATEADKIAKWYETDNRMLHALIIQEGNGINLSQDKENIKRIHKHWPNCKYK